MKQDPKAKAKRKPPLPKPRKKAPPKSPRRSPAGLTPKQQAFVREYLIDLNATGAAIRAGYSAATATVAGARLLANVKVKLAIDAAMLERSERTKIDADWLLKRLSDEAVADANDLYDNTGHFKAVSEWPMIWRQGLVAGIEMGEVEIEGQKVRRPIKIKLSDRVKRLELVGKHIGVQAFRERIDHGLVPGTAEQIVEATMSAKEAAEVYRSKLG
jgi:phage terminase small subunit